MKRVTGTGGIFFKAQDPDTLRASYQRHLGIDFEKCGGKFLYWIHPDNPQPNGETVWTIFPASSDYFSPSTTPFMINYRVPNLVDLLEALRKEGREHDNRVETSDYRKFGWVIDPEGNKNEL